MCYHPREPKPCSECQQKKHDVGNCIHPIKKVWADLCDDCYLIHSQHVKLVS